jgi:hypothetical protein
MQERNRDVFKLDMDEDLLFPMGSFGLSARKQEHMELKHPAASGGIFELPGRRHLHSLAYPGADPAESRECARCEIQQANQGPAFYLMV